MKTNTDKAEKDVPSWPLLLIALPAGVATWSGWVGLGEMCGFGMVKPLPGIAESVTINTAITLPIGVEAYAAYALGAWLSSAPHSDATKKFAGISAVGSLVLGMAGQVAYHLLETTGQTKAPWWIVTLVSCLPVLVLGMGATLRHMLHRDKAARLADTATRDILAAPVADATPAVVADEGDTAAVVASPLSDTMRDAAADTEGDMPRDTGTGDATSRSDISAADDATPEGDIGAGEATRDNVRPLVVKEMSRDLVPVERRPRVASEDPTEKARELLAVDPDIKGAELGRRLGLSPRQGQRLLAALREQQEVSA